MTLDQLEAELARRIDNERREGHAVVLLLAEAMRRKLYAHRGHPSLFKWLVERFRYAEDAAHRRIAAARLIRDVPAAAAKLARGDVTLTALARVDRAVREQEKATGRPVDKARMVASVEGLSARAAEVKMMELLPETASRARRERVVALDAHTDRVTVNLNHGDLILLAQVRDLLSHARPNASRGELISLAIGELYAKLSKRAAKNQCVKLANCTYRDERTGTVCGGTYMMENDHVVPRALGGGDEPANRRPLCRVHNQLAAEIKLGAAWANAWRGG